MAEAYYCGPSKIIKALLNIERVNLADHMMGHIKYECMYIKKRFPLTFWILELSILAIKSYLLNTGYNETSFWTSATRDGI